MYYGLDEILKIKQRIRLLYSYIDSMKRSSIRGEDMHKILKQWFVFFVIAALVMSTVGTVGYAQDSSMKDSYKEAERSSEKMTADIVFLRPAGILATAFGAAVFIVSSPFSALGGNFKEAYDELVKEPARYTFKRPLGDF